MSRHYMCTQYTIVGHVYIRLSYIRLSHLHIYMHLYTLLCVYKHVVKTTQVNLLHFVYTLINTVNVFYFYEAHTWVYSYWCHTKHKYYIILWINKMLSYHFLNATLSSHSHVQVVTLMLYILSNMTIQMRFVIIDISS